MRRLALLAEAMTFCLLSTAAGQALQPDQGSSDKAVPSETKPPANEYEELWRDAMAAYHAHYSYALRCDVAGMRQKRSDLTEIARNARNLASKARRQLESLRRRKGTRPGELERARKWADYATAYEKAIEELLRAVSLQGPMNCPTSELQPPQPPPPPPKHGSQDCPVPGGVPGGAIPGKTLPQHGMRFTPPDQNSERMLAAHNRARAEVGVPPLAWDRELAVGAAAYAMQMSMVGRVHAPRESRECVRENLLQSLPGSRSPDDMVGVWVSEKSYFRPGTFPDVSTTGAWSKVGHYTQIIWSMTTHVGCAVHSDAKYDWTVCRYTPPGNQDGKSVLTPSPVAKQPIPPQPVPIPHPIPTPTEVDPG